MTDEDRQLLLDLRRMTDACGAFCAGVIEHDLSRDDQLALSDWLAEMAERIRKRGLRTPVVIEGEGGCRTVPLADVSPVECDRGQVSQTGEAV
ncbi:MAG: hypothetical protein ACREXR_05730 [Gammaproteobacteria bacterium]